jgi:hypothetical protein
MKLIIMFLLLAVGCSPIVCAQAADNKKPDGGLARPPASKAQLQLSTSLVERKHHCSNLMSLRVKLTFKNTGSEPIILDKRSFIGAEMVSHDLEAAAAKQYETTARYDLFDGAFFAVDPSDMSNFIILKPGEVYEKTRGLTSLWLDDATPPREGYLSPGTHYLQIIVSSWSYFTDPKPLQKRWSDKGVLWLEGLTSLPMPFTVENDPSRPPCQTPK